MNKKIIFTIILAIIFILFLAIYQFINKEETIDNENIENTNSIEENITKEEKNFSEKEKTNENKENEEKNERADKKEIVTQISPGGFMGSSMYRVVLYSNKEVYLIIYDGNGYEEKNKVSEELIARNVDSIKRAEDEERYGEIIIIGGTAVNNNMGWIKFE